MDVKYIVYHNRKMDTEDIIVFSGLQQHRDVAAHLPGDVISAGFVQFSAVDDPTASSGPNVDIQCYGESTSLNIQSRPQEDTIIARALLLS